MDRPYINYLIDLGDDALNIINSHVVIHDDTRDQIQNTCFFIHCSETIAISSMMQGNYGIPIEMVLCFVTLNITMVSQSDYDLCAHFG